MKVWDDYYQKFISNVYGPIGCSILSSYVKNIIVEKAFCILELNWTEQKLIRVRHHWLNNKFLIVIRNGNQQDVHNKGLGWS